MRNAIFVKPIGDLFSVRFLQWACFQLNQNIEHVQRLKLEKNNI